MTLDDLRHLNLPQVISVALAVSASGRGSHHKINFDATRQEPLC